MSNECCLLLLLLLLVLLKKHAKCYRATTIAIVIAGVGICAVVFVAAAPFLAVALGDDGAFAFLHRKYCAFRGARRR